MRVSAIMLAVALAGCSTGYGPSGLTGGYEETQIAPNVWRVSFTGNGFTTPEQTQDFALLRSAELAAKNGYRYFAFASGGVRANPGGVVTSPGYSMTSGSASIYGNTISGSSTTFTAPGSAYAWTFPTANNTVVMFREKPQVEAMIYDAQFICESLGTKYKVKCS